MCGCIAPWCNLTARIHEHVFSSSSLSLVRFSRTESPSSRSGGVPTRAAVVVATAVVVLVPVPVAALVPVPVPLPPGDYMFGTVIRWV